MARALRHDSQKIGFRESVALSNARNCNGNNKTLLPVAVTSAIDGRLGILEDHIARREFTREVKLDLLIGLIADSFEFDRDDLKRRCAQSVRKQARYQLR